MLLLRLILTFSTNTNSPKSLLAVMLPFWFLVFSLTLLLAEAAELSSSSFTLDTSSIQSPPTQWSTGQPYTTFYPASPTATLIKTTTSTQVSPTVNAFVATRLPISLPPVNTYIVSKPLIIYGFPGYEYAPLYEQSVKQSTAYTINLIT